ncbi:MAG: InlB B-repeat-containing protein [Bacilli bacterium]|nr:InlB B-repeat-containing protein [Bacilli bacterium]
MKKLVFIMPLMAVSLLTSCGGNKEPTKVSYTLTYTYDNGTTNKYVETYAEDKKTVEPTWEPTYPGNTFEGWFTKSGEDGTQFTFGNVLTDNTVVYAHWSKTPEPKTTYHLTFKGTHCKMDGTDKYEEDIPIGASTQRKIYPDEGYALPVQGQGEELTITGEGASSVSYENGNIIITKFSGNVEITAKPSLKDCVVTFNPNGGKLIGSTTVTVSYGTKFSAITGIESHKAQKDLCLFNGWALTSSDKNPLNVDNDYDIKGDLEVYAILVPQNTVELTFNGTNCRLWKNNIMQEGIIDIISGIDNIFTIEPINSYLPVFLTPVTSTNMVKCEFNPATKQLIINANLNCSVTASTTKQTLEECTWSEIDSISAAGLADEFFDIGETKTVKLFESGTEQSSPHTIRIIDFNHDYSELPDEGDPDPNNVLGITFEFANVITKSDGSVATTKWNDKQSTSSTNYDYRKSTLNDFLNDKTEDVESVINMLPSSGDPDNPDLREVIKPVDKKVGVSTDKGQNYIATSFDGSKDYPYPYLFPLAHDEIAPNDLESVVSGEGSEYQYYKNHISYYDWIKKKVGASSDKGETYWLRSPYPPLSDLTWRIRGDGALACNDDIFYSYAVAPAFCI